MKKAIFFVLMGATAIFFTACKSSSTATAPAQVIKPYAPKLVSHNDSLSYAISLTRTEGLSEVMYKELGVDSAYLNDFIEGVNAAFPTATDAKAKAYKAGMQIGLQADRVYESANKEVYPTDTTHCLDRKLFIAGLVAGVTNDSTVMSYNKSKQFYTETLYKGPNAAFVAANAKKPGVITTASGLQYKIIKSGGNKDYATLNDTVKCKYTGSLIDGKTFDSSRDKAVSFPVNKVIKGWTEALQMMSKGDKWELYIPYNLAYGENGNQRIPPYSTLIFEIELTDIVKAK